MMDMEATKTDLQTGGTLPATEAIIHDDGLSSYTLTGEPQFPNTGSMTHTQKLFFQKSYLAQLRTWALAACFGLHTVKLLRSSSAGYGLRIISTNTRLFTVIIVIVMLSLISLSLGLSWKNLHSSFDWTFKNCEPKTQDPEARIDLYGLGFRFAIYSQLSATAISHLGLLGAKHSAFLEQVNVYFLWALLGAIKFSSEFLHIVDLYILLGLGNGILLFLITGIILPPSQAQDNFLTTIMQRITAVLWAYINFEFWWSTAHDQRTPAAPCELVPIGWLLVPIALEPWNLNSLDIFAKLVLVPLPLISFVIALRQARYFYIVWRSIGFLMLEKPPGLQYPPKYKVLIDCYLIFPAQGVHWNLKYEEGKPDEAVERFKGYLHRQYRSQHENFKLQDILNSSLAKNPYNTFDIYPDTIRFAINFIRLTFHTGIIVVTILNIELTIMLNHLVGLSELNSAGQLSAVLISVGAIISMGMEVFIERHRLSNLPIYRTPTVDSGGSGESHTESLADDAYDGASIVLPMPMV